MTKSEYLQKLSPYGLNCRDCKGPNQGYMVQPELWRAHAADVPCSRYYAEKVGGNLVRSEGTGNFICVSCFEIRLGRDLTIQDFTQAPINHGGFGDFDCKVYTQLKSRIEFVYGANCKLLVGGKAVADADVFKYGNMLLVDDLMVYEDFRRKGYGSLLVQELKKKCKAEGWKFGAYGIVATDRARKFWAKHRVKDYFEDLKNKF